MMASKYVALPTGRHDRILTSSKIALGIQFEDESRHVLPAGTTVLFVQSRICGDEYCEIEGARIVSAIGATREEAFLAALGKAA